MNCPKCGVGIAEGARYCPACDRPQSSQPEAAEPSFVGSAVEDPRSLGSGTGASPARVAYAGFWLRLAAYIVDSLVLGVTAGTAILAPLMASGAIPPDNPWILYTGTSRQFVALRLLILMIQWVYFAVLESSPWQASVGKRVFGLIVTDLEGKRISFGRATARFFATLLSGFILLAGFIMIGFTQRKQALHDILTGCLVIKKL